MSFSNSWYLDLFFLWPQGGCVCVRVWWQRVSVPPSLKLMSKPGLHKTCGRKSWEVRLMITSRDGIPVRMFESQGYRAGSGKWERREQQPCGWDGKVGRHCLRWPVQVLQLLDVHTLSCLGDWVAFSGLTLDLKLWMCDRNLLFCFCYLACCFPTSLLRRGDIWWLLESSACWITFSASSTCYYLNNQTVILVFTTESSVGLLSELTLWDVADLPQAHLRNCSVLDWSLTYVLPVQDCVSGKVEEVSRSFRSSF